MIGSERRLTIVLFVACALTGLAVGALRPSPLQAQSTTCASCQPSLYNYATLSGPYKVCVESNSTYAWSSSQASAVASGKDYWNNYFSAAGINIKITFAEVPGLCSGPNWP